MIKKPIYEKHMLHDTYRLSISEEFGRYFNKITLYYSAGQSKYFVTHSDRMWFNYILRTGG